MKFSHDYSKLGSRVFTTIRAGSPVYDPDQVITCKTPTTTFRARVLYAIIDSLDEIPLPLLRYDCDRPGASREEIIAMIQSLYRGRCPEARMPWTLYVLEREDWRQVERT